MERCCGSGQASYLLCPGAVHLHGQRDRYHSGTAPGQDGDHSGVWLCCRGKGVHSRGGYIVEVHIAGVGIHSRGAHIAVVEVGI